MRSKADRELIEKAKKLTERQRLMEEVLAKRRPVNGFDLDALQSEIQRDFGVAIDRTLIQQATDEIERLQGKEFRAVVDSAEVEGVLPSVGVSSSPEIDWFSRPDEEIRPLFERIKDDLCARVYGQDRACSELVDAYRRPYLDRSVDRVRQT
ncbi:MAG: hypothetical protein Q4A52_06015, partial [Bacillota bacterium]|nr:hypothetical protein [Bacillota bacterium]